MARLTMIADSDGMITAVTGEVISILGYSARDLVGRPIQTIVPERYREAHRVAMDNYRSTGVKKVMGSWMEVHALRRDGSEIAVTFCVTERKGVLEALMETPAAAQLGFLGLGGRA